MIQIRQCTKCGHDVTDASAFECPICGTQIARTPGGKIWILALVQFIFAAGFMLLFRFPKWMIPFFGVMIVIGTLLASRARVSVAARRPTSQTPVTNPVLLRLLSILI